MNAYLVLLIFFVFHVYFSADGAEVLFFKSDFQINTVLCFCFTNK